MRCWPLLANNVIVILLNWLYLEFLQKRWCYLTKYFNYFIFYFIINTNHYYIRISTNLINLFNYVFICIQLKCRFLRFCYKKPSVVILRGCADRSVHVIKIPRERFRSTLLLAAPWRHASIGLRSAACSRPHANDALLTVVWVDDHVTHPPTASCQAATQHPQ